MPTPEGQHLLFVTGRLAEASLRDVLKPLAAKANFTWDIAVPGIQVAALLHTNLLKSRLQIDAAFDRIILPGWVQGDIEELTQHFGLPFEQGPKDLRDLPEYFGFGKRKTVSLDSYSIEIIGEINHATRQPLADVIAEARSMTADGANVIDVGCVPGESSPNIKTIVSALVAEGLRVSIDSFDRHEVEAAVDAGAELILSANHSNIDWVTTFGTEVVLIPDTPADTDSLHRLVETVTATNTPFRIDPIIEPIGMGFAASLQRYMDARQRFPELPIMMGIGNVTELAEVDSAGVNMVLAAICEELGIQSVLTTQVINWCRSAVKEFDAARRLVHYAITNQTIAKHLDSSLAMLRNVKLQSQSESSLKSLAEALTDNNFRIFAEDHGLHLMNRRGHWKAESPFEVFAAALQANPEIDAAHAFYLGVELARAETARLLGKNYVQDEPMSWGLAGELPGSSSVRHD